MNILVAKLSYKYIKASPCDFFISTKVILPFSFIFINMKSYIYIIKCLSNGKEYVGKTNNPNARMKDHFYRSKNDKCKQVIHSAIQKHGAENFTFEVILECESDDAAFFAENMIILEKRKDGIELYNMNDGGVGGSNPTLETRKKMSASRKGMKLSEKTKTKISKVAKTQWDQLSEDDKKNRMKKLQSGVKKWRNSLSQEDKELISEKYRQLHKGKPLNEEVKEKISKTIKKKFENKIRASQQIEEYVVNCIYCAKEMKRKKPKTFAPQSKNPCCRTCSNKLAWKERRITQNIEEQYVNIACTNCGKEIPPKKIGISIKRNCVTCGRKKMWERRKLLKASPCDSQLPLSEQFETEDQTLN